MAAIPVKRNFYRAGLEGDAILPTQAGFKDMSKFGAEEEVGRATRAAPRSSISPGRAERARLLPDSAWACAQALYKEAGCKYGDVTGMMVHMLKKDGHKVTVTDEPPQKLGEALPWPGDKK